MLNTKAAESNLVDSPVDFTVFINPKMRIVEQTKFISREGCLSIPGMLGDVMRYSQVSIEGMVHFSFLLCISNELPLNNVWVFQIIAR